MIFERMFHSRDKLDATTINIILYELALGILSLWKVIFWAYMYFPQPGFTCICM